MQLLFSSFWGGGRCYCILVQRAISSETKHTLYTDPKPPSPSLFAKLKLSVAAEISLRVKNGNSESESLSSASFVQSDLSLFSSHSVVKQNYKIMIFSKYQDHLAFTRSQALCSPLGSLWSLGLINQKKWKKGHARKTGKIIESRHTSFLLFMHPK